MSAQAPFPSTIVQSPGIRSPRGAGSAATCVLAENGRKRERGGPGAGNPATNSVSAHLARKIASRSACASACKLAPPAGWSGRFEHADRRDISDAGSIGGDGARSQRDERSGQRELDVGGA